MSRPTNQYSADFMPYLKHGLYALRHGNWIKAYGVFADSIRTLHPDTKEREALDRESNWDSPEDFKALLEWVEAEFNPQDIVPANMAQLTRFFFDRPCSLPYPTTCPWISSRLWRWPSRRKGNACCPRSWSLSLWGAVT